MEPAWLLRFQGGALGLLLAGGAAGAQAGSLQAIVVDPTLPDGEPLDVWMWPSPVPERIRIDLGLGDDVGGRVLRMRSPGGHGPDYRVQVQFETSAAIGGEGPHIDLLDWKHCRSAWRPAKPEGSNGFRLPMPLDDDHSCFPEATHAELRAALKQALDKFELDSANQQPWLDAIARVPRVGEYPSYVAISTVRVRIEQYDGRQWRVVTTIEFAVPMGC
jgi:hypothetical protein